MPTPAVAIRLSLVALAIVAMLGLVGCGPGDSATPGQGETAAAQKDATARESANSGPKPPGSSMNAPTRASCRAQLGAFLGSLNRLRTRLAAGLSYQQYATALKGIRAAYNALPVDRLPPDCLVAAGTAAEKAFNRYIEAANAWGECLADAGCNSEVVEPELQREWQVASHWLSEAHAGLRG